MWFRPGRQLVHDDQFPAAANLRDANSDEHRRLHRVGVWADGDAATVGARLRHELHHALQWDSFGAPICDLYDLIRDEVVARKVGGLNGCAGMLINALPAEQDCNAAAAMYLRGRHPDQLERLCRHGDYRQLACSIVGPEPMESLPARMIAFAAQYPDRCAEAEKARGTDFGAMLESIFEGARSYWTALGDGLARTTS